MSARQTDSYFYCWSHLVNHLTCSANSQHLLYSLFVLRGLAYIYKLSPKLLGFENNRAIAGLYFATVSIFLSLCNLIPKMNGLYFCYFILKLRNVTIFGPIHKYKSYNWKNYLWNEEAMSSFFKSRRKILYWIVKKTLKEQNGFLAKSVTEMIAN